MINSSININIISLIGMTGVGKTTVGQCLSEKLKYNFFDLDEIIIKKTKKTPSEIFASAENGEEIFRQIETQELENIFSNKNKKDIILSCGGGIVLNPTNREILRKNSFVIWLLRPIDDVIKNEEVLNRPPINGNINNYIEIFKKRENLYAETCNLRLEYSDVFEASENIINILKKLI